MAGEQKAKRAGVLVLIRKVAHEKGEMYFGGMKKLLFAVAIVSLAFCAFLLWENYHYAGRQACLLHEVDSLKNELGTERWMDTVDNGQMARGHYPATLP